MYISSTIFSLFLLFDVLNQQLVTSYTLLLKRKYQSQVVIEFSVDKEWCRKQELFEPCQFWLSVSMYLLIDKSLPRKNVRGPFCRNNPLLRIWKCHRVYQFHCYKCLSLERQDPLMNSTGYVKQSLSTSILLLR